MQLNIAALKKASRNRNEYLTTQISTAELGLLVDAYEVCTAAQNRIKALEIARDELVKDRNTWRSKARKHSINKPGVSNGRQP